MLRLRVSRLVIVRRMNSLAVLPDDLRGYRFTACGWVYMDSDSSHHELVHWVVQLADIAWKLSRYLYACLRKVLTIEVTHQLINLAHCLVSPLQRRSRMCCRVQDCVHWKGGKPGLLGFCPRTVHEMVSATEYKICSMSTHFLGRPIRTLGSPAKLHECNVRERTEDQEGGKVSAFGPEISWRGLGEW